MGFRILFRKNNVYRNVTIRLVNSISNSPSQSPNPFKLSKDLAVFGTGLLAGIAGSLMGLGGAFIAIPLLSG